MANIFNMVDTWNDAATTFTSIKMNVTDTASNASSLLMDLQVGGVSQIYLQKTGAIALNSSGTYRGLIHPRTGGIGILAPNNNSVFGVYNNKVGLSHTTELSWSSSFNPDSAGDLRLFRDAADTLAQRNGTNAQTSRIYGTFTNASNHRFLALTMSTAGVAEIKPEGAGTGETGNVLHISGLPTSNPGPGILWNNAGTPAIGT